MSALGSDTTRRIDSVPPPGAGRLAGRRALVTGASQGIGRAIALALAREGAAVAMVGRRASRLRAVADAGGPLCRPVVADLGSEPDLSRAIEDLLTDERGENGGTVDLLVHAGGQYVHGTMEEVPPQDLDTLYALTVRAPYVLTRMLLPLLRARPSDVVFIGSTVRPGTGVGAFAAVNAAQQALVRTMREEVSGQQIRVLSVFPGRTATPRQEHIFELEGRPDAYRPGLLLQPEDVAEVVLAALSLPRRAEVTELWLRPATPSY